jgi:hypothetical protein
MNNKISFIVAIVLLALVAGGYYFSSRGDSVEAPKEAVKNSGFGVGQKAIVYKSPTCGCCTGYADELKKQGFEVEVVPTDDMSSVKNSYGIPSDKQSCHTIAMGDYFIEGHVPMEAVEKLLKEQPEVEGIGLPRMPAGTPGMGGAKRAPYEVYQVKDGEVSEFITI